MAFRKRPRSPEQTFNPNDPLDLEIELERITAAVTPQEKPADLVVTGLSDEEDARRHLELRFNKSIGFCGNCESYYEVENVEAGPHNCPICEYWLSPVGTAPFRIKGRLK